MVDNNLNNINQESQEIDDNKTGNDILFNKITKWKEKLIDLTKRNRLLNFKCSKNASIKIIDEIPIEIFKILVTHQKSMNFLPIRVPQDFNLEDNKLSKEALNKGIDFKTQAYR